MNSLEILKDVLLDFKNLYNSHYDKKIESIEIKFRIGYNLYVGNVSIVKHNKLQVYAEIIIDKNIILVSASVDTDDLLIINDEIKERLARRILTSISIAGTKILFQDVIKFQNINNN
jgi:hypothetical protein